MNDFSDTKAFDDLPDYAVSMSVYSGEKTEFLKQSIDSMLAQTYPCKEFILVCDGALNRSLYELIAGYESSHPDIFRVIRMDVNCGVGACANAAIEKTNCPYILKMDSDDIALPERCEKQLRFMSQNPQVDMCGAYIEEFDSDTGDTISIKRTPTENEEIRHYAKRRNPFNNQTLVYKRTAAINAGGYTTVRRCEDYDFVVRMLRSGAVGANIPEVLVRYRVTPENLTRRRNFNNTKSFIAVRWRIYRSGYSSLIDFIIPSAAQLVLFVLPKSLTGKLYKKFLRG